MKTRSQSNKEKQPLYEVNIDFDDASLAWKSNKKSIGNGSYKYICTAISTSANYANSKCGRSCYKELLYCWQHRNYEKNNI